jgi:hypothetical protein
MAWQRNLTCARFLLSPSLIASQCDVAMAAPAAAVEDELIGMAADLKGGEGPADDGGDDILLAGAGMVRTTATATKKAFLMQEAVATEAVQADGARVPHGGGTAEHGQDGGRCGELGGRCGMCRLCGLPAYDHFNELGWDLGLCGLTVLPGPAG